MTNSKDERAEAHRGLDRTTRELRAMVEITQAVAGETELSAVLNTIATHGRALVSARMVLIELADNGDLVMLAGVGEIPEGFLGQRVPAENTIAGRAMAQQATQRVDVGAVTAHQRNATANPFGMTIRDALVVPMMFRGEPRGALLAIDRVDGRPFDEEDQALLEAFAVSAALAVGSAQSAADARRRQALAAAEAERGRWARELHDETLQALAGIRFGLASARQSDDLDRLRAVITAAVDELQSEMDELRALITELRPAALDQLGVEAAIVDLTQRFERTGVGIDVVVDLAYEHGRAEHRLIPELETTIYRTVQEALTNVTKHSGARGVIVEVLEGEAYVDITIRDDGAGFDTARGATGLGLISMRERVGLVEGRLEISAAPGRGTTVRARLPAYRRGA